MYNCARRTGIALALTLCGFLPGGSGAAGTDNLSEQFSSIKQDLIETAALSQTTGARATYHLLQQNLATFHNLRLRVLGAAHVDDVIGELSAELDNIAGNFEKAARLRSQYRNYTHEMQSHLQRTRQQTRRAVDTLERRVIVVSGQLDAARLASADSQADALHRERNRITVLASSSILNSLRAQQNIWARFARAQQRLYATLLDSAERVDFVLFTLETNARVYREAANTAQLRRSAQLAIADLQALGNVEGSMADLEASWHEVDQIIREIGSEEFRYDANS